MRRAERLFQIIQVLRSKRRPVTGRELADELEISLRTLYRDMAELLAQRVPVRGEAGTGYVIDADYDMPPLMLTREELEAAIFGAAWVTQHGDPGLQRGARDLIAKLLASVPEPLRDVLVDEVLRPVTFKERLPDGMDLGSLRAAIRGRRKVRLRYADADGQASERVVWPFLVAFMDEVRIVAAWCELRQDFRHFRTDRIVSGEVLDDRFPERIRSLRQRWEVLRRRERPEERPAPVAAGLPS